jgi:hypothetical protein
MSTTTSILPFFCTLAPFFFPPPVHMMLAISIPRVGISFDLDLFFWVVGWLSLCIRMPLASEHFSLFASTVYALTCI